MADDLAKTSRRRLAAVLSADAVGYSRLMNDDDQATIAALPAARRVFRDRIVAHAGRVVDTEGDSVLAVFDSVVESLDSAVEIQRGLDLPDADVPPARLLRFRIGINVGDLVVRLNPSLANAHYGLGLALVLVGRPEEALPEIDWAERLSPHDPFLWLFDMGRAWAWVSLGDFERSAEQAERSVRRATAGFPAWLALASALGHLGRIAEAKNALAKALELEPRISPELFAHIWPNMDSRFFELFIDGVRAADPEIADPRAAGR